MMKYCLLTMMALVLAFMPVRAAIYMVGNTPFGDWNPGNGIEMTDKGNGIYTFTAYIGNTVWFVFADGQSSDWNVFNANYRYGPTGSSQEVTVTNTYTTQKSNNNHSYKFVGAGKDYTFTFNLNDLTFSITEYQEPALPDPFSLQQGDVNGDGEVSIADVTALVDIVLGGFANYDTRTRADINHDHEMNIADITSLISLILGGHLAEPVKEGYDYVWDDDIDIIPEIHIDVPRIQWNRLLTLFDINPYTTQYVMATATFVKEGETTVIDSVGLRLKGNTSRRRPEGRSGQMHERNNTDWHHAHFGLNLRKFVDDNAHAIQGVRKLHLKWFKDDPMYVREKFCYDLFKRAGVWTAIRDNYCRLWIHVEGDTQKAYYGVYEMLEPIDKRYLKDRKKQFGSSDGYLWKCRNASAGMNNPNGDIWYDDDTDDRHAYTLETQTEEFDSARVQLQDFMNKLCYLSDSEFYNWIQQSTDIDLLLKTYAVNVAVGMWDDYWNNANNYYIYFNARGTTGYKFFFIPFDYDNTLGTSLRCGVQSDAGRQDPLHWGNDNNPLIARILKFNDFKAKYVAFLKELIDSKNALMDRPSAQARIRAWQSRIEQYIDNDTGEETVIEDKPASWSNHSEYNLLMNNSDNFFNAKAASINALH